jgi:hypothetical protein
MSNDAYSNMDADTKAAIHDNYIDEQTRQYEKRKELINKFMDGWAKYNKIPLFRNVIDAAVRGADPWDLIDKLIDVNVEQSEAIKNYLILHAYPSKIEIPKYGI